MYWYVTWWHDDGTVEQLEDPSRGRVREADGRNAEPSAGLIDSQSVRTADTVPAGTRGFDAGKKAKGRKRVVVTDTLGLLLAVHVVAANIQDRDGAKPLLLWTRLDHQGVQRIWADQGFAGRFVEWSGTILGRELEIVRKAPDQRGFQVQPKRWAVERTFSWLTAHRRLARDYETSPARSETMIRWAMIGIMVRRLTRGRPATRPGPRSLLRDVPQKRRPSRPWGMSCVGALWSQEAPDGPARPVSWRSAVARRWSCRSLRRGPGRRSARPRPDAARSTPGRRTCW